MVDTKKTETKEESVKKPAKRVRKPLHSRNVLEVPEHLKRPGFKYRFVNEEFGRVQMYEDAGYKVVLKKTSSEDSKGIKNKSAAGEPYRIVVNRDNNARANTAVLMEIPLEFYLEDKAEIHKQLDEKEAAYDPEAVAKRSSGFYGHSETKRSGKISG